MTSSLYIRLLKTIVIGMIASLPIHTGLITIVSKNTVLFMSLALFLIIAGYDAYRFSFICWKKKDFYLGQLLPLAIYGALGFLTCLIFKPVVFNRIFLPLRFAGCFGMETKKSVVIVTLGLIVFIFIIRLIGAKLGRLYYGLYARGEEETK